MHDENPQAEERIKMFHPIHTFVSKFVTNFEAKIYISMLLKMERSIIKTLH